FGNASAMIPSTVIAPCLAIYSCLFSLFAGFPKIREITSNAFIIKDFKLILRKGNPCPPFERGALTERKCGMFQLLKRVEITLSFPRKRESRLTERKAYLFRQTATTHPFLAASSATPPPYFDIRQIRLRQFGIYLCF